MASHPNKIRTDYTLNPCQAIAIPEGQELTHCAAGTWVCQDVKILLEGDKTQTVYLNTVAGSAPAKDKAPAREVAPATARANKIEDVKECKNDLHLFLANFLYFAMRQGLTHSFYLSCCFRC